MVYLRIVGCTIARQESDICGSNSAVECQLPKLDVAGSIPVSRSSYPVGRGFERRRNRDPDFERLLSGSRWDPLEDFSPNRLVAAKDVAAESIRSRVNDRIGLVIFSGESFTQRPLTTDYAVLKNLLQQGKNGMIADGTAIGLALANGVNRLKDSQAQNKVMILLTDGVSNRGQIDPITSSLRSLIFFSWQYG